MMIFEKRSWQLLFWQHDKGETLAVILKNISYYGLISELSDPQKCMQNSILKLLNEKGDIQTLLQVSVGNYQTPDLAK